MSDVASPAVDMVQNRYQSALVELGCDAFWHSTRDRNRDSVRKTDPVQLMGTSSEGAVVRLACANAATTLGDLATAATSSENMASASALIEVSLALWKSESRFDAFCAENASAIAAQELRLSALESRPTDVTALATPLARVTLRVIALEAKLVSTGATYDKADSTAHIFDDGLPPDAVAIFVKNVLIPGLNSSEHSFLSPECKDALNKRETARWHAILLDGRFSDSARCPARQGPHMLLPHDARHGPTRLRQRHRARRAHQAPLRVPAEPDPQAAAPRRGQALILRHRPQVDGRTGPVQVQVQAHFPLAPHYAPRIENPPLPPSRSQWNAGYWQQQPPHQQHHP